MDSTVNLTFRYQESDYLRAVRAHLGSRLHLRFDLILALVLVCLGAYLRRSPDSHSLGVTVVIIATAFALILIAGLTLIPRLAFRREPKFRDEYSLTFSPEGIHFRTAHIDSRLQWRVYSRALIDPHSYVLYYGSRHFTVIPKRVFQNPADQQILDRLLVQHIPQIIRREG